MGISVQKRAMTDRKRTVDVRRIERSKIIHAFGAPEEDLNSLRTRATMKAQQSSKIKELRDVLVTAGFSTLDRQAAVLGLSRSTTWTVLRGNHKNSGLSATIINRMLRSPRLPAPVRIKIVEYIKEKAIGLYGHSESQRQKFAARLSGERGGYRPHPMTESQKSDDASVTARSLN
jgi:hypothetical protein